MLAGVLQEAGDANSRVPYHIPSISSIFYHSLHFHVYQIYNYHCVVAENDKEMERVQVVDLF